MQLLGNGYAEGVIGTQDGIQRFAIGVGALQQVPQRFLGFGGVCHAARFGGGSVGGDDQGAVIQVGF